MRFLSARRRHPLAGLVVVLLGLVLAGTLYSAFGPASADDSGSDTQQIADGRQLYVVGCSSCHGLNGEGIITKDGDNNGPPLIGVGAAAVNFQLGTGRMPLQQPNRQAQPKEVIYSPEEISAMAAYVATLGPGPAIPAPSEYDTSDVDEAGIVEGRDFFATNCTACHNFNGAGGAMPYGGYAPSLLNTSNLHIFEAMLTGPGQMPVFGNGVITPDQKRKIIAYINTLQDQTNYGGSNLGSKGALPEGLWGWLLGIGSLVGVAVWIGNNGVRAGKKKS